MFQNLAQIDIAWIQSEKFFPGMNLIFSPESALFPAWRTFSEKIENSASTFGSEKRLYR
jgi:hypothetical protein